MRSLLLALAHRVRGDRHVGFLQELRATEGWSPAEVRAASEARLQALLLHAWTHVPYYREPLRANGVVRDGSPPRVDLSRFRDLPLLERTTIRERAAELLDVRPPTRGNPRATVTSSGTTGNPIRVVRDRVTYHHSLAVEAWFDEWAGYRRGEAKAVLWGLRPPLRERPRAMLAAFLRRESRLYSQVLSDALLDAYIARINRVRPAMILGYPSAVHRLARRAEATGQFVAPPDVVMVSAEALADDARETIVRVLRAPVVNRYGSNELGGVACQCLHGRGLHVSALTHHVEVLRPNGMPCEPGETGELVVTLLPNRAMPLIRYRIGDLGALEAPGDPCPCGRPLPSLAHVTGRVLDAFVRGDGTVVHGLHLQSFYRQLPWIARYQLVQVTPTHVHVRLVDRDPAPDHRARRQPDLAVIEAHLRTALGPACRATFEFLTDIPPERSGKYRATLSRVVR